MEADGENVMPIIRDRGGRPKLNPHPLIDYLIEKGWGKNDGEIAKLLGVSPGTVSKVRNGKAPTSEFVLAVYDATDLNIDKIRELCNAVRSV